MEPEEIGFLVLRLLVSETPSIRHRVLGNTLNCHDIDEYARRCGVDIRIVVSVLAEGWAWLVRLGLLAREPEASETYFITRRGRKALETGDPKSFLAENLLPVEQLDPALASVARSAFLRGEYESAVFLAFKEVEVRVRQAAGMSDRDIGTGLMRRALDVNTGVLSDMEILESERQGMSDLFAGAIALFKNPTSHRHVELTDPHEAKELIFLANHLLRLVAMRECASGSSPTNGAS